MIWNQNLEGSLHFFHGCIPAYKYMCFGKKSLVSNKYKIHWYLKQEKKTVFSKPKAQTKWAVLQVRSTLKLSKQVCLPRFPSFLFWQPTKSLKCLFFYVNRDAISIKKHGLNCGALPWLSHTSLFPNPSAVFIVEYHKYVLRWWRCASDASGLLTNKSITQPRSHV